VAHLLGWFGKMLIMRDWYIIWVCSIVFEFLEITFRYWLPNFWECWWDHLLLDVFGMNLLGSLFGALFLQKFAVTRINWIYEPEQSTLPNCGNKISGALSKLAPVAYEKYNWAIFSSPKKFLGVLTFVIVCLTIDCNNFFLKALYWIPADHEIMKFRIFMWGFAALATAKEWYEYTSNVNHNRVMAFAWMTFYTCGIEVMMTIKAGIHDKLFDFSVFPWFVYLIWICFAVIIAGCLLHSYRNEQRLNATKEEVPTARVGKFNSYNPEADVTLHTKSN